MTMLHFIINLIGFLAISITLLSTGLHYTSWQYIVILLIVCILTMINFIEGFDK